MENAKTSLIERLNESNNVLVTVAANPSVDQLSAAIGITLVLNKLGKHATTVFSGNVPSTIEFLKPEETIENNTDSLRDFIIALDKSKADKLRYKVEDKQVKIFITPYHTSITQDDLIFSQGDFNVDVVLALGVHEQTDLDQAITSHGRILHDATVATVNTKESGNLGTIDWVNPSASSLCEMLVELGEGLKKDVMDGQMATALLTGIVAETARFSNEKTTPTTMSISARLMNAGANQQLVATKLQEEPKQRGPGKKDDGNKPAADADASSDGSLSISHQTEEQPSEIQIDEEGQLRAPDEASEEDEFEPATTAEESEKPDKHKESHNTGSTKFVLEPPTMGGAMSTGGAAAAANDRLDEPQDTLSLPPVDGPLLNHDSGPALHEATPRQALPPVPEPKVEKPEPPKPPEFTVPDLMTEEKVEEKPAEPPISDHTTLEQIEESVESPHVKADESSAQAPALPTDLDAARKAVEAAALAAPDNALPTPNADLNATGDLTLTHDQPTIQRQPAEYLDVTKLDEATGLPSSLVSPADKMPNDPTAPKVDNPTAPPPVPPPMMPPGFGTPNGQNGQNNQFNAPL